MKVEQIIDAFTKAYTTTIRMRPMEAYCPLEGTSGEKTIKKFEKAVENKDWETCKKLIRKAIDQIEAMEQNEGLNQKIQKSKGEINQQRVMYRQYYCITPESFESEFHQKMKQFSEVKHQLIGGLEFMSTCKLFTEMNNPATFFYSKRFPRDITGIIASYILEQPLNTDDLDSFNASSSA